jgi:hypothetical protein
MSIQNSLSYKMACLLKITHHEGPARVNFSILLSFVSRKFWYLKGTDYETVDWVHLGEDRVQWPTLVNAEMKLAFRNMKEI